jgi:hypothetical protein
MVPPYEVKVILIILSFSPPSCSCFSALRFAFYSMSNAGHRGAIKIMAKSVMQLLRSLQK